MTSWVVGTAVSYMLSKLVAGQTALKINVIHATPGRIRLQCNRWKNEKVAEVLEGKVVINPLIKRCSANPITGSLLIEFTKDYLNEKEFDQILRILTMASTKGFAEKEADALSLMKRAVKKADDLIKSGTQGMLDSNSIIVLSLLTKGLLGLRNNSTDYGRNLLWAYRFLDTKGEKR